MRDNKRYAALALGLGLGSTLVVLWLLTGPIHVALADVGVRYVALDGDDSKQCDTIADRCCTVQRAIDVADLLDEVRVATGIYTDAAGTVASINKTITLLGGWSADYTTRDSSAYPTTLDAQGNGRVVFISGSISPTVDGFFITGGNADSESIGAGRGGGIYSASASPVIQSNVITNNVAYEGTAPWGHGGGLYLANASASTVISGNQVLSNTASTTYYGLGGGMSLHTSAGRVVGNDIRHNYAGRGGGGVYLYDCYDMTFDGNRVVSNTATLSPTTSGNGGGFYLEYVSPLTLTNNVVAQNYANVGGGLYAYGSGSYYADGLLVNNTIVENNVGPGKEGLYATGDVTLTLSNNIIAGHTYGIHASTSAIVTATHTLFYENSSGDTGGAGSIASSHEITGSDPLFVGPAGWEYHILADSPAIDAGVTVVWLINDVDGDTRPQESGYDIGADEYALLSVYLPLVVRGY